MPTMGRNLSASAQRPRRRWDGGRVFATMVIVAAVAGVGLWGYSFFNHVDAGQGTRAAGGNVFTRPSDPEVGYPAYGSNDLVRYLEKSMVDQRSSIGVAYWTARSTSTAELTDAMHEALSQSPYIYVRGWMMSGPGNVAQIEPEYTYSSAEAQRRRQATVTAVHTGIAELGLGTGQGEAATAAAIYDYVTSVATYDYGAYEAIKRGDYDGHEESQEAYGILVTGTAVCNGYAKAYLAMAEAAGLDAVTVTGEVSQGMTTGNHAWNKVNIDGQWLTVDATWDDDDDGAASRDYFLLADGDAALATRTADLDWVMDDAAGNFSIG